MGHRRCPMITYPRTRVEVRCCEIPRSPGATSTLVEVAKWANGCGVTITVSRDYAMQLLSVSYDEWDGIAAMVDALGLTQPEETPSP
jgi:hypothetical protein